MLPQVTEELGLVRPVRSHSSCCPNHILAAMESYVLPHLPPNVRNVHIAYFENVANAPEIRARLVAAATAPGAEGDAARASVDFGFVEASLVSHSAFRSCS